MKFQLFPSKKGEIKPYVEKQRYSCPFYGFYMGLGMLVDQEGNQCALITQSYSPCKMKTNNQTPSWKQCPFNTEENKKKLIKSLENVQIFPNEFQPPNVKSWQGIKFTDWADYILKQNGPDGI